LTKTKIRAFPIAVEGWPFAGIALGLTLVSYLFSFPVATFLFGAISLFILQFFRNPERQGSRDEKDILSPADGEVIGIELTHDERFLKDKAVRISIFMNVFNVHVNRSPCAGVVKKIVWSPGKFFAANAEKASLENEQNAILLEHSSGQRILFIQIAGLIARRILCYVKEGDRLEKGERCGIIKFGSRVDIYLPAGSEIRVRLKEKVKAGETTIGQFR